MNPPEPSIRVNVDLTNPGQFFACCGLLELADRLWPGAEGWFEEDQFCIDCASPLDKLIQKIIDCSIEQLDPGNDMSSPMHLSAPFNLTLDWWTDEIAGGKQLKVWAGRMRSVRIALAMRQAMRDIARLDQMFVFSKVVFDPDNPKKKVEPYYFDSRRGQNAQSIDIGFSPDSLKMKTAAHPAVEFLCLVGLQRFRPALTKQRRVFDYIAWANPLTPLLASSAANAMIPSVANRFYRFENAFRTDQKKHKSFLPATQTGDFT